MYRSKACNKIGDKKNRGGSKVKIVTTNKDGKYIRHTGIQAGASNRVKIFGQVGTRGNILKWSELIGKRPGTIWNDLIGKLPGTNNNSHYR